MIVKELKETELYKMISNMNISFGNKKGLSVDNLQKITSNGKNRLIAQIRNLYDENKELKRDGFDANVRKEIFDAIADLSVFLYGSNHFLNRKLSDFSISFTDETIKFGDKFFNDKELAKKYVEENSFEILNREIDSLITSIENEDLEKYDFYAKRIAILLFTIFELFKKENRPEHTMIYLNHIVNESNLSKLCKNQEEIDATLHFYRRKNVEVDVKPSDLKQKDGTPFYIVYSTKDQFVHDQDEEGNLLYEKDGSPLIKEYRENKFLKNTIWFEPDLSDF